MSRLRLLDIDSLLVLRSFLLGGNSHDAARALHLTEPAIRGRIKRMEFVFGERTITTKKGRESVLTDHGLEIAMVANECLKILERLC